MPKIVTFEAHVPKSVVSQISQLAKEYVTDLAMNGVPPSNTAYSVYQYALSTEIEAYLVRLGKFKDAPVGLVVAFADEAPDSVIGFVLYLPVIDNPEACGLTYMAVTASQRRKGLARAMLNEVATRSPHMELTCFISKVPMYEKMGFQVLGCRDTQITMNNRPDPSPGAMAALFVDPILTSPEVRQIQHNLVQKYGVKAMLDDEKRLARQLQQLTQQADNYVRVNAEKIVKGRRPAAAVDKVTDRRYELRGVAGLECHDEREELVWIQAAYELDKRFEPELRRVDER
ncbi:GNAT family N-acetyltransferase [Pseudomonas veronii]|uniref:GNAT family N-acetyltransferase n=1 Tax=Pseudomonas veronii TaxID=76761 RepID=UPI0015A31B2D|nr:GNAT family N-acetyltransferase [Pseudomonas veronii]